MFNLFSRVKYASLCLLVLSACAPTNPTPTAEAITPASFAADYKAQCLADPEPVAGLDNTQFCACAEGKLKTALEADSKLLQTLLKTPEADAAHQLYVQVGNDCAQEQTAAKGDA